MSKKNESRIRKNKDAPTANAEHKVNNRTFLTIPEKFQAILEADYEGKPGARPRFCEQHNITENDLGLVEIHRELMIAAAR